nr:invertebrate-type lysozyme 4 [Coridius chinensis]
MRIHCAVLPGVVVLFAVLASGLEEPSTTGVEEPSTTGVEEPSTTGVEEPSTTGAEEPSTTGVEEPSTTEVEMEPVSRQCLACMCKVISNNNFSIGCDGEFCGAYKLTKEKWIAAGQPLILLDEKENEKAFENCATDSWCAAVAVQNFLVYNTEDCNGDGRIDCEDYTTFYNRGGCNGTGLYDNLEEKAKTCREDDR